MKIMSQLQDKLAELWQKHLAPRYQALNESEQRIVRIAAIIIPVIVFIFGIILPISDNHTRLSSDIKAVTSKVAEANQLADMLATQPKSEGQIKGNLLSAVDGLARQTGVRSFMTRLRPQPLSQGKQQLQSQIKDAPYPSVVAFIAKLEQKGLSLSQLKIQGTKPGYVHMQAMISE